MMILPALAHEQVPVCDAHFTENAMGDAYFTENPMGDAS